MYLHKDTAYWPPYERYVNKVLVKAFASCGLCSLTEAIWLEALGA